MTKDSTRRRRFHRAAAMLARFEPPQRTWNEQELTNIQTGIMLGFDVASDYDGGDVATTFEVLSRYYRRYKRQLAEPFPGDPLITARESY